MAVDFIAGLNGVPMIPGSIFFCQGLAGLLAVHPLDTIKTRLQMQSPTKPRYRGTFHCFVSIVKQESLFSLYKGMASPALTTSTLNSLIFGVYGLCIGHLDANKLSHHFLAGGISGIVQSPLSCFVDMSKIRVQMQGVGEKAGTVKTRHYRGSIDAMFKIFRKEGLRGCFRGQLITIPRDSPATAVYFASYEGFCSLLGHEHLLGNLPVLVLLLAGGLSGMISWASIYPLDVVKTRYQADGVSGNSKYSSYGQVVGEIYHEKGVRGFFTGLSVTMLRAFPANAAIFGAVALTHHLFQMSQNH